jgi:hypothetical protein
MPGAKNLTLPRSGPEKWRRRKLLVSCRNSRRPNKDLLSHTHEGYQLETDSLGGDPILRRLNYNEVIRPMSANRNTIKAMEKRGLIHPGKGRAPLTIVWRLKNQGT